jgi:hypothetical protein
MRYPLAPGPPGFIAMMPSRFAWSRALSLVNAMVIWRPSGLL